MERILLVSATEKSRTMLSQFLTSCGVQAQLAPASSGAEARRMLVDEMCIRDSLVYSSSVSSETLPSRPASMPPVTPAAFLALTVPALSLIHIFAALAVQQVTLLLQIGPRGYFMSVLVQQHRQCDAPAAGTQYKNLHVTSPLRQAMLRSSFCS